MKIIEHVIKDEEGIHASPASMLCEAAKKYKSDIWLCSGEHRADMKNVFDILRNCIKKDMKISIEISGEDEDDAMAYIIKKVVNL